VNDTRVLPARLWGHKASGGRVQLLLLHAIDAGSDGAAWVERWYRRRQGQEHQDLHGHVADQEVRQVRRPTGPEDGLVQAGDSSALFKMSKWGPGAYFAGVGSLVIAGSLIYGLTDPTSDDPVTP